MRQAQGCRFILGKDEDSKDDPNLSESLAMVPSRPRPSAVDGNSVTARLLWQQCGEEHVHGLFMVTQCVDFYVLMMLMDGYD